MATAPNVQNDAATTRRYSSMPAPMYFGDRVRKPARAASQMATSTSRVRRLDTGPAPCPQWACCRSARTAPTTPRRRPRSGVGDAQIAGVPPLPLSSARSYSAAFRSRAASPQLSRLGSRRDRDRAYRDVGRANELWPCCMTIALPWHRSRPVGSRKPVVEPAESARGLPTPPAFESRRERQARRVSSGSGDGDDVLRRVV